MSEQTWKMPRAIHETIVERAEADYPEETCGFVFGEDGALEVLSMQNMQNKLHAEDPERFGRDARTAYYFDPLEMQRILDEKEKSGVPFRAIYHSHPDHDSYFSETDSAAAAPFGEPNYPGVVHLVYSVYDGKLRDLKAFDWSESAGAFTEVPVKIEG